MKKILSLILLLVVVLGFSGCSEEPFTSERDVGDIYFIYTEENGYLINRVFLDEDGNKNTRIDRLDFYTEDQVDSFLDSKQILFERLIEERETHLQLQIDTLSVRIEELRAEVAALKFDSTHQVSTLSYGLNGRESIYMNLVTDSSKMLRISDVTENLKTNLYFDKDNQAPDYIKDVEGDYIDTDQLGILLKAKYFNGSLVEEQDLFTMGDSAYYRFYITDQDMTDEELFVRTTLLIEELRNYTFYIFGSTRIIIHVYNMHTPLETQLLITVPMQIIVNNYFELTPGGIMNEDFETSLLIPNVELDEVLVQSLYDGFIVDETFIGYVLNYN